MHREQMTVTRVVDTKGNVFWSIHEDGKNEFKIVVPDADMAAMMGAYARTEISQRCMVITSEDRVVAAVTLGQKTASAALMAATEDLPKRLVDIRCVYIWPDNEHERLTL